MNTIIHVYIVSTGAYLFKAYSNGHPYDTSQVWVAFFTGVLKEDGSCPTTSTAGPSLLPAIIVPAGYPNQRTWEALRRYDESNLIAMFINYYSIRWMYQSELFSFSLCPLFSKLLSMHHPTPVPALLHYSYRVLFLYINCS